MTDPPLYMQDEFWPAPADGEFLRPRWKEISAILDDTREGADHTAAWSLARDRWIAHTLQVLNASRRLSGRQSPYCIGRSSHFLTVAPYQQDIADDLSSLGEKFRTIAQNVLGRRLTTDPHIGYVVLILDGQPTAQKYLQPLGVDASKVAGVFLGGAFPHIVMHNTTRFHLRLTFIHELNHAVLHQLPIPHWVHEGLSRYFESRLLTVANMHFTAEMDVGRNRYWRENGLADFWNGSVFFDRRATLGYVLAHKLIIRLFKRDAEAFTQFMLKAHRDDAGDAACWEIYGSSILDEAKSLLGPGDWKGPGEV